MSTCAAVSAERWKEARGRLDIYARGVIAEISGQKHGYRANIAQ